MQDDSIRITGERMLSDDFAQLKQLHYDQRRRSSEWQRQQREVHASAGGAAVLLYDRTRGTVLLTFMPNPSSLTEVVHCFVGEYERGDIVTEGGGKKEEGEDIEVLEIDAGEAFAMVRDGRMVIAKTVILPQALQQVL